jgi:hypothetical protein
MDKGDDGEQCTEKTNGGRSNLVGPFATPTQTVRSPLYYRYATNTKIENEYDTTEKEQGEKE